MLPSKYTHDGYMQTLRKWLRVAFWCLKHQLLASTTLLLKVYFTYIYYVPSQYFKILFDF